METLIKDIVLMAAKSDKSLASSLVELIENRASFLEQCVYSKETMLKGAFGTPQAEEIFAAIQRQQTEANRLKSLVTTIRWEIEDD